MGSVSMSTKKAAKTSKKSGLTPPGKKAASKPTNEELLAPGGGSGPAAGVPFQAAVGAFFAVGGMAPRKVDERLELGAECVQSFRFETEAPVDDILILTSRPGRLFFQAKTNLRFGNQPSSEMMKTVGQIVRQWKLCAEGDGSRGWNTHLDKDADRFVIAVGPETPATVAADLSQALSGGRCPCPCSEPMSRGYEYIFRDERKRQLLIECIDIFVEAGWPSALRLLYRLPDALR
jgi:hypothetical protein